MWHGRPATCKLWVRACRPPPASCTLKQGQVARHEQAQAQQLPVQVEKLRGTLKVEYTLADVTARKLWKLLKEDAFVPALGAVTGNQAIQMVRGGLKSVYCSGWQVRRPVRAATGSV